MGKTWRRIPGAFKDDGTPNYDRHTKQPKKITCEWALKRLKPRIECWTDQEIERGYFRPCDREDLIKAFEDRVCKAVSYYDAKRVGSYGGTVAATTYIRVAFEYAAQNVLRDLFRKGGPVEHVSIVEASPDEVRATGVMSSADVALSDRYKSVKSMCFAMDIQTLLRALPEECRTYLKMQCAGYTLEETAEAMKMSRRTLMRHVIPILRFTARLHGFFSQEDVRRGLDNESLYRKGGKFRPSWAA